MSASVIISLDTRRIKKEEKYPVKLLVTFKSEPKRYQTIYDLTQEEFDNLSASRVSEKLKVIRESLKQIQRTAEDIIKSLQPFSYQEFEKDYILDNVYYLICRTFYSNSFFSNSVVFSDSNLDFVDLI